MFEDGKSWMARQTARWHTLVRSFQPGNDEDKYRVLRFISKRLPLGKATKEKLLGWGVETLHKRQREARAKTKLAQAAWDAKGHARLTQLLQSAATLEVPALDQPTVSIILVTHNKSHLSLLTIESVIQHAGVAYELILVDNGSADSTSALLERVKGAHVIRNAANVGFGPACMQAFEASRGDYLCFLNNDALLTQDALRFTLLNFRKPDVGAVGGKILLSDGRLQEAGSIIWSDGSAVGYGRGDDPELPQYSFRRPVDYCSGVFLVTPTELFGRFGGFSPEFAPAYYEDTDYCMTLWHSGFKVMYEPLASILHYESASSGNNDNAVPMMSANQVKFQNKWQQGLAKHCPPHRNNVLAARIAANSDSLRIVYIDDRVPAKSLGTGFPRSNDIVTELAARGHHVVCATSTFPVLDDGYADLPREVEVFDGHRFRQKLVSEYMPNADVVWISRPHNLKLLLRECPEVFQSRKFALVYDAEAIFSQRIEDRKRLFGEAKGITHELEPTGFDEEIALAKTADEVVVVSEADRRVMIDAGLRSVHVVGHSILANATPASFEERDAFLFVGSMHGLDNPNADSVRSFYQRQWQQVHQETGAFLVIAGFGTEDLRAEIKDPTVEILGKQEDLRSLYNRARVFVVPTRYAAGVPYKAHEAAAHGVPTVVSPIIANQLRWIHGLDYFAAEDFDRMAEYCVRLYQDEALWQSLRDHSLARVDAELSPTAFAAGIDSILRNIVAMEHMCRRDPVRIVRP
jgi:GT2 family glycosyltransferase/glycosyltransferase involved in cell wall biosynthesis